MTKRGTVFWPLRAAGCVGVGALLLIAGVSGRAAENDAAANSVLPFGQLASSLGLQVDTRTPLIFGLVDNVAPRAMAPPMRTREGWQPRLGAALEATSNPRFADGGSPDASAWALLAGLQYAMQDAELSAGFDISAEAIDATSADLRVETLDSATASAYARGLATERLVWEANALLQRAHEPDGGLIPEADQRRFRADRQSHRFAIAWRLAPTLDMYGRAALDRRNSLEPASVDNADGSVTVGVAWRSTALQRLSVSLQSRQVDFEQLESSRLQSLQLRWEQQWAPTWLTEFSLSPVDLRGRNSPLLWRVSAVNSQPRGNLTCYAERTLDAAGNLGRLLDVRRARCDAEWRLGDTLRLGLGLEAAHYELGEGGLTLRSLRPRLALLWPMDAANWLQLRATAVDDRLSMQLGQRRDLRLQLSFIHTFKLQP